MVGAEVYCRGVASRGDEIQVEVGEISGCGHSVGREPSFDQSLNLFYEKDISLLCAALSFSFYLSILSLFSFSPFFCMKDT